jgi:hypothetical protein
MKTLTKPGLALFLAFNAMTAINTAHTMLQIGDSLSDIAEHSIALKATTAMTRTVGKVFGANAFSDFAAAAVEMGGDGIAIVGGAPGLLIGGAVGKLAEEGREIRQSRGPR